MASLIHKEGVAHTDLRSANILLTPNGVMLIDFGIAFERDGEYSTPHTFKDAMKWDTEMLLRHLKFVYSLDMPSSLKQVLTLVIDDFSKRISDGNINENTAAELSKALLFVLAQLGARR